MWTIDEISNNTMDAAFRLKMKLADRGWVQMGSKISKLALLQLTCLLIKLLQMISIGDWDGATDLLASIPQVFTQLSSVVQWAVALTLSPLLHI